MSVTMQLDDGRREEIARLVPQVRRIAARWHRRYPSIEFDEFLSTGQEATVGASTRWEPERGRFGPFALAAAHYAMCELARVTLKIRKLEQAWVQPLRLFDDEPREGFLLSPPPYSAKHDWQAEREKVVRDLRGRLGAAIALVPGEAANDGEEQFLRARAMTIGRAVIDMAGRALDEPERTFFLLYFQEQRTLDEVALALGRSKKATRLIGDRVNERLAEALREAKVG